MINHEQPFHEIKDAIKKSSDIEELMGKLNTIAADNTGYATKFLVDSTRSIKRDYPEADIVFIEYPEEIFDVCTRGTLSLVMQYSNLERCTFHYVSKGKNS